MQGKNNENINMHLDLEILLPEESKVGGRSQRTAGLNLLQVRERQLELLCSIGKKRLVCSSLL